MDLHHQVSSLVYGVLCCFYLFFIMRKKHMTHLKVLFKVLPLFVLFLCLIYITFSHVAPFHVKSPSYLPRLTKAAMAVLFSMMGDAYLVYSHLFIYGLVAFAVAQGFLVLAFSDNGFLFSQVRSPELTSLLCISVVSLGIYFYLLPKFDCVLAILSLLYCALLTVMLWSAIMQTQKHISALTVAGAVGAGLFYVSDTTLFINKWRRGTIPVYVAEKSVMITYYLAQYIIVLSFIYSE